MPFPSGLDREFCVFMCLFSMNFHTRYISNSCIYDLYVKQFIGVLSGCIYFFLYLLNPCYQRVNAIVSKNIKKGKKRFGKEKVKLVSLPTRNARNVGSTKVHNLVFVFFERELKFF